MRTTVTLDDDLVSAATEYSGIKEKSALLNRALKTFVELGRIDIHRSQIMAAARWTKPVKWIVRRS